MIVRRRYAFTSPYNLMFADCFIPEFWVTRYPPTSDQNLDLHLMTGFLAGIGADEASKMSHETIISKTITQLDRMFGACMLLVFSIHIRRLHP